MVSLRTFIWSWGKVEAVCRLFSLIFILVRVSKIKKVFLGHRKITGFSQEKQYIYTTMFLRHVRRKHLSNATSGGFEEVCQLQIAQSVT